MCTNTQVLLSFFLAFRNSFPRYRGEYSTELFTRKGIDWITNITNEGRQPGGTEQKTLLYMSYQAVHGPIEAPPLSYDTACGHIREPTRHTYCEMMQSLDDSIGNITAAYTKLGIFDDTVRCV